MNATNALPDMTRTREAVKAHDEVWHAIDRMEQSERPDVAKLASMYDEVDRLAEAVGLAFGLDTADRNNVEDCHRLIRPSRPGSGSFVRRMLALSEGA